MRQQNTNNIEKRNSQSENWLSVLQYKYNNVDIGKMFCALIKPFSYIHQIFSFCRFSFVLNDKNIAANMNHFNTTILSFLCIDLVFFLSVGLLAVENS